MDTDRLKIWERLFQHAIELIESVPAPGLSNQSWSFGGGTVLMRRHRHRFSKDIDIFLDDPQHLGHLAPRLNDTAEQLTHNYDEGREFLKLYLDEGEIDFIVAGALTLKPTEMEQLFGRDVRVETSTEIIAKKVWYRGAEFTARDIFDLAMVTEREPSALKSIKPILLERSEVILGRIEQHQDMLRETFGALDVLDYERSFEESVEIVRTVLRDS